MILELQKAKPEQSKKNVIARQQNNLDRGRQEFESVFVNLNVSACFGIDRIIFSSERTKILVSFLFEEAYMRECSLSRGILPI
jgi:hypothetical protein